MACAPASPWSRPAAPAASSAARDRGSTLFGPGDAVIITRRHRQGLQGGQRVSSSGASSTTVHRAAEARRVSDQRPHGRLGAPSSRSKATMRGRGGDLRVRRHPRRGLPRALSRARSLPGGARRPTPDFAHPGRLVLGDERRQIGDPGTSWCIDRGSDHGVRAGQPLDRSTGRPLERPGPIIDRRPRRRCWRRAADSIVRIDSSRDAIYSATWSRSTAIDAVRGPAAAHHGAALIQRSPRALKRR